MERGEAIKKLVDLALGEVGTREEGGNNCGARIVEYQKASWLAPGPWPWCFHGDVELLTDKGWVRFADFNPEGALVAQVSKVDFGVTFVPPCSFTVKDYEGELLRVKTRSFDFVCDPHHKFVGYWNSKTLQTKSLKDITTRVTIPAARSTASGTGLSFAELDFIAAFVADGFFHRRSDKHQLKVRIQVSKARKISACEQLPQLTGRYTQPKAYGGSKTPLTTFEYPIPQYFYEVFSGYKMFKWEWVLSLSQEQCAYFCERYNFWDGDNKKVISSSRKENIDALTAMAALAGRHVSQSWRLGSTGRPNYTLRFGQVNRSITRKHITSFIGKETLYCVQVPAGALLLRDQNGATFVAGNCAAFCCWLLREWVKDPTVVEAMGLPRKPEAWRCKDASAFGWEKWGRLHGCQILDENATAKAGDFVIFDFSHIGIVVEDQEPGAGTICTCEGNTSEAGSREGDGVYTKIRNRSLVRSYIRIP